MLEDEISSFFQSSIQRIKIKFDHVLPSEDLFLCFSLCLQRQTRNNILWGTLTIPDTSHSAARWSGGWLRQDLWGGVVEVKELLLGHWVLRPMPDPSTTPGLKAINWLSVHHQLLLVAATMWFSLLREEYVRSRWPLEGGGTQCAGEAQGAVVDFGGGGTCEWASRIKRPIKQATLNLLIKHLFTLQVLLLLFILRYLGVGIHVPW